MLAVDYPILNLFFTIMFFFLWVAWIVLVFRVIADVFRNDDLSGGAKALWLFLVVLIPWLGVLAYLLSHGADMSHREIRRQVETRNEFEAYLRETAGGRVSTADELTKLAALRDIGIITDAELAAQKAKLLASW